ncbi:hypothetical protein L3X38_040087 [Prunus dulcis]|uniref:Exostosin family protein n=1 Tax=Prunus dulcis TaxID=3755 RepID=A0AAD4YT63_PRUDU|nr:hypothetical protein L3X38_040087 [Prunus dulcis]
MERTLKIYIDKDGNKPIFHQPILKGLYASEGWLLKLMQGYKRFAVKDPRKAHLFYMPFSSRMLEYTLYVRNSHNRTNLRQFLKEYSEKIVAKYPYWNRTGGADHFLVACHDWAPYETRHHMERCIKALCNDDVTDGFKIGRDVSLKETYVRSARNPLRDLGDKPPSQRQILAFYAGNVHGYLRPILIQHWKDKDPDMKIFGPMVRVPFSSLKPIFRARTVSDAPPFEPSNIASLQAHKFEFDGKLNPTFVEGAFKLPLSSIPAYLKEPITPRLVRGGSAGITRPDRPGLDLSKQPPAVRLNKELDFILTFKLKEEDLIRESGIPYTIVRPCALTEEPAGANLIFDQGDNITISREEVAHICVGALESPYASGETFEVKSVVPFSEPFTVDPQNPPPEKDYNVYFKTLKDGITGKEILEQDPVPV